MPPTTKRPTYNGHQRPGRGDKALQAPWVVHTFLIALATASGACHLLLAYSAPPDQADGVADSAVSDSSHDHSTHDVWGSEGEPIDVGAAVDFIDSQTDGAGLTCEEQFGQVPGFEPCEEALTWCQFGYTVGPNPNAKASCDEICLQYGQTVCLGAADASNIPVCDSIANAVPCSEAHNDGVCTCQR
jgi:hypothetical protein